MNILEANNIYFLGIGGIGMSALARYFQTIGKNVAGFDRAETSLTNELSSLGIDIHFDENESKIPSVFKDREKTIVVYTPAVPSDNKELVFFRNNGYEIFKRAEILGLITKNKRAVCISGTHGKTTVTTMTAYLLYHSEISCSAFLGGISKNFNSNLILSETSDHVVVEADEFDRSFLKLYPEIALITYIDADHLDIYGTHDKIRESFEDFISQIKKGGTLIIKRDINLDIKNPNIKIFTYSLNKGDFFADNIRLLNHSYIFDIVTPFGIIKDLTLKHPGLINVENSVAAVAASVIAGVDFNVIKERLSDFQGVKRRIDYILNTEKLIYIDDYAHHPREIDAVVSSVKKLYPEKKLTAIFQPHLYSRTRDFASEFAESLSNVDDLILLDIYPARELPIEGVTSKIIFDKANCPEKVLIKKDQLLETVKNKDIELLVSMGAGDIDTFSMPLKHLLSEKYL